MATLSDRFNNMRNAASDRYNEMRGGGNNNNINPGPRTWRDNMTPDFKQTCPSLSYETRLWGFLSCILFGVVLSFFGTMFLYLGRIQPFAIYYSIGSLLGLFASAFVVGPCKQLGLMFQKNRWLASLIYLGSIGGTMYAVFVIKGNGAKFMAIGLVCIQFLAGFWYGLSFIPYGRIVIKKMIAFTCCGSVTALD